MKILFLTSAAPQKAGFSTSEKRPPHGVGFLISVLREKGHKVFFSDEYLEPSDILKSDFVERINIDFVGIYANTICYQSTLKMFEILERKRKCGSWKGKIMVGGPHTSVGVKEIPDYVDHIVIGEGEISVPEIVEGKTKDRIIYGEKVKDLDSLPMPPWDDFVKKAYNWSLNWVPDSYPVYTMNTSRGCPYGCTFCSVKSIWGKTYRFMSAERVVRDIEHLIKYYGAKGIYFREDHFTLNKNRIYDFCNLLLRKNINIDWFCESRVDNLQDIEIINLMAKSGCKALYIGVESGSPKMLNFYKKGETVDQFINTFNLIREAGIKSYASFVVGCPTENQSDIELTEKLIKKLKPDYVGRNVYLGSPGSELYNFIKNNNLYEFVDNHNILYPINFKKNCIKYYGYQPYYNIYSLNTYDSLKTFIYNIKYLLQNNLKIIKNHSLKIIIFLKNILKKAPDT